MGLNLFQRISRMLKIGNAIQYARAIPFLQLITIRTSDHIAARFNKYHFAKLLVGCFILLPSFGLFRRSYIRNKYRKYLEQKKQVTEIELKQSIAKFDLKIPKGLEYMVIINLDEINQRSQDIGQIDKENSRKIFNLIEQAQQNSEGNSLKWVFLGSKKLYQTIENSRTQLNTSRLSLQFHENSKLKKQSKVFLIGHDAEGEQKVIMEWDSGVGYKEISKYIAKHKYKKYLAEITF